MGEGNKESVGEHCVMVGSCSTAVAAVRAKKQEDVERQTAVHVGSKRRGEKTGDVHITFPTATRVQCPSCQRSV